MTRKATAMKPIEQAIQEVQQQVQTEVRPSMLGGRKAFQPLQEGTAYPVKLVQMLERPAEEGKATDKFFGFVDFKWESQLDGRIITDSRSVPLGTDILSNQIIQQLELQSGIDQEQMFADLLGSEQIVDMYITHNDTEDKLYTNYQFIKPREKKVEVPVNTDDGIED